MKVVIEGDSIEYKTIWTGSLRNGLFTIKDSSLEDDEFVGRKVKEKSLKKGKLPILEDGTVLVYTVLEVEMEMKSHR